MNTPEKTVKPVIVLDAGGVLVDYDESIVFEELEKRYHRSIGCSPQDLHWLLAPVQIGKASLEDVSPELNRRLGVTLAQDSWQALWRKAIIGEMPGMREALAALKPEYKLVALSNTISVHWDYLLEAFPVFDLLDGWVASHIEGFVKPDAEIYRRVEEKYCGGRPPSFFTDDTPGHVIAARSIGWKAELFNGADDFVLKVHRLRNHLDG